LLKRPLDSHSSGRQHDQLSKWDLQDAQSARRLFEMTENKTYRQIERLAAVAKDSLLVVAIIACCIAVLMVYFKTKKPEQEPISSVSVFSPEYQGNMTYLSNALMEAMPDFSKASNGWLGAHIPIVHEQDFPWFAYRLRKELRDSSGSILYHSIVVGGMKVRGIDEPVLEASSRFRGRRKPNVEIVIVAPSTISAETKQILEKRGIEIRLVGPPSRDHFR
jgi:hypothetical protein